MSNVQTRGKTGVLLIKCWSQTAAAVTRGFTTAYTYTYMRKHWRMEEHRIKNAQNFEKYTTTSSVPPLQWCQHLIAHIKQWNISCYSRSKNRAIFSWETTLSSYRLLVPPLPPIIKARVWTCRFRKTVDHSRNLRQCGNNNLSLEYPHDHGRAGLSL